MHFEVAEPCDEPWDAMTPRGRGRHCDRCDKVVLDLSAMTRARAEQTLRSIGGPSVCVRLAVDPFGDAVFQRPPPSRAPHWAAGVVLVSALAGASACTEGNSPSAPEPVTLEGDPGPPMTPTEPTLASIPRTPSLPTRPVPAAELADAGDHDARPTAEQRALTAAKHRPLRIMHTAGVMLMPVPHGQAPVF